jgi:putative ABC transport system permease protein
MRGLIHLHALILRLLPPAFRREYGADLNRTFRERVAERRRTRGWFGGVTEAGLGCVDAARSAWRLRAPIGFAFLGTPGEALTSLRRSPGWSLAIVAILGLGIGATTAMVSVVASVLRPLPYDDAGALIRIGSEREDRPSLGSVSPPNFRDLEGAATSLAGVAASSPASLAVRLTDGPAEVLRGGVVSGTFFDLLGVPAIRGRVLAVSDDQAGAPAAVVLSHELWQARWGGRDDTIGQSIVIDGRPTTVVGVMGPDFQPPEGAHLRGTRLWIPLAKGSYPLQERTLAFLDLIGRLADGRSLAQARTDIDGIGRALAATHGLRGRAFITFRAAPLLTKTMEGSAPRLAFLTGSVALLLLITCANVAHLMLVRTVARRRELAVRAALGGGAGRVRGYVLWQALLLAIGGGIAGAALAGLGVAAVTRWAPVDLPRLAEIHVDGRVLALALGIATLAGLLVGIVPALRVPRKDLVADLRAGGRSVGGSGRPGNLFRDGLIVVQTAVGLMLLMAAGLMAHSLLRLEHVDPGFRPDDLFVMSVRLSAPTEAMKDLAVYQALLDRVRAVPGVQAASLTTGAPFVAGGWTTYIEPVDGPRLEPDQLAGMRIGLHQVSGRHLTGLGAVFVAGRDLADTDGGGAEPVAVISRTLADRFWPAGDAVGHALIVGGDGTFAHRRIVGVVEAPRYASVRPDDDAHVYLPYAQFPPPDVDVVVRAPAQPGLGPALRAAAFAVAPDAPIIRVERITDLLARELVEPRFLTGLLSAFAAIAVLLSCCGVFGTLAYAVEQRRHEIGVRLALGARREQVVRLVVARGGLLIGLGVGLGLAGAAAGARGLDHFMFGITSTDPPTLAGVTVSLVAVALLAAWLPARRAGRIEPALTMRAD